MAPLNALALACEIHRYAGEGNAFIVIAAENAGGGQRWSAAFPSLTTEQVNALDEQIAIRFYSEAEAREAFTTICRDVANNDGCLITGTITLVASDWDNRHGESETRTLSYEIGDEEVPVFNGLTLTRETVFLMN